jgi:PAS domain S-box-containing protein
VTGEASDYRLEKRYVRKDGAVVWVNVNVTLIRDADGKPLRTMAAIEDITDRRNIEDALRESERSLNEAQRIAQIGSYVTDIASGIWVASPTLYDIFGMDSSYVTNIENWGKLMAPGFEQEMVDYYYQVIKERGKFNKEYQVLRPRDGRTIWVSAQGEFTFDAGGTPLFLKGTIQDITERKQAEEALREETRRRYALEQEVLAIAESEQRRIGHDLHDGICQELTGIQYIAEHVAMRLPEELPEKALLAKTVEDIRKTIVHTRHLSHSLSPAVLEKSDLATALSELAGNTEITFGIACGFSCQTPPVISSPVTATHLYRITQEAIQNAIRHGKATSIEISLRPSGPDWILQIADNGTPSETEKKPGRGLHIMRYRASMIGGSIHFRKIAGTTLLCTFPL